MKRCCKKVVVDPHPFLTTERNIKDMRGKINEVEVCEISSSHGGEYDVQSCLLGCTAV